MTENLNDADLVISENRVALEAGTVDNPNPGLGTPSHIADAPAGNDNVPTERPLSKREEIAAAHKRRRQEQEGDLEIAQNDFGEYVPPFIQAQQNEADEEERKRREEEEAAKKAAETPKSYTLRVRGVEHPVASRDELIQLAELEPEEAQEFSDSALIRMAQKQMAASSLLEEAKTQRKLARSVTRDADDTLSDPEITDEGPAPDDRRADEPSPPDQDRASKFKAAVEKIQFGDADEAVAALAEVVNEGVKETLNERQYTNRLSNAISIVQKSSQAFEAANADLLQDRDFSDLVYNRAFVAELKKDLVSQGLAPENVDRVVGNDIRSAMSAYTTIAADGRLKVRHPDQMLAAAAQSVRTKFNRPAPTPANGNTPPRAIPTAPPAQRRLDMKRAMVPQPSRASVPRTVSTPANGQAPAARSNVVLQMRQQRGQARP